MDVKSIRKYNVVKSFTIFDLLFLPSDVLYISSSFRGAGSSVDWMSCFDSDKKHMGKMNQDYFWALKDGFIELVKD